MHGAACVLVHFPRADTLINGGNINIYLTEPLICDLIFHSLKLKEGGMSSSVLRLRSAPDHVTGVTIVILHASHRPLIRAGCRVLAAYTVSKAFHGAAEAARFHH